MQMSLLRVPHFLTTVRHYVMLEVDKTRAINPPPPKKQSSIEFFLLVALRKNLRYKNAKGSTRSISPDAKRSTGVIVPASNAAGEARRQRPAPCGGEKHSSSSAAPCSKRAALGRLSFGFLGCFGANPRSRETLSPFAQDARRAAALRQSARFGKARCTGHRAG